MPSREFPESSGLRTFVALYFIFSGTLLLILTVSSGLVFFTLCCSLLWTVSGFIWLSRPSAAARICAFPVLGIGAGFRWLLLPSLREHFGRPITWLDVLPLCCVVIALALVVITIRKTAGTPVPVAISLVLMVAGFFADRGMIIDQADVHSFSMKWTVDGSAPWSHVDFDAKKGPPIVLYREYARGYCFDVLYSEELRRRLIESNKPTVMVEYTVLRDFGRERGYNLVSVDGWVFSQGGREVRPGYAGGGSTQRADAFGTASCNH
jgi:hypothetical protein